MRSESPVGRQRDAGLNDHGLRSGGRVPDLQCFQQSGSIPSSATKTPARLARRTFGQALAEQLRLSHEMQVLDRLSAITEFPRCEGLTIS